MVINRLVHAINDHKSWLFPPQTDGIFQGPLSAASEAVPLELQRSFCGFLHPGRGRLQSRPGSGRVEPPCTSPAPELEAMDNPNL